MFNIIAPLLHFQEVRKLGYSRVKAVVATAAYLKALHVRPRNPSRALIEQIFSPAWWQLSTSEEASISGRLSFIAETMAMAERAHPDVLRDALDSIRWVWHSDQPNDPHEPEPPEPPPAVEHDYW